MGGDLGRVAPRECEGALIGERTLTGEVEGAGLRGGGSAYLRPTGLSFGPVNSLTESEAREMLAGGFPDSTRPRGSGRVGVREFPGTGSKGDKDWL